MIPPKTLRALTDLRQLVEHAIALTATGARRNHLTEVNMHLMQAATSLKAAMAAPEPSPPWEGQRLLSTGQPATLGSYRETAQAVGMRKAVAYLDRKIAEAPNGANEEVLAEESQMLLLLASIEATPEVKRK